LCRLSNKKYRLPNNMRRCQALSADGLRLISWRDIIFFLCVFQSLVFLALFLGPMPLYVAEVPCYLTENEAASRLREVRPKSCERQDYAGNFDACAGVGSNGLFRECCQKEMSYDDMALISGRNVQ